MFAKPKVAFIEESIRTAFIDAARRNDGKLYILAASGSLLSVAQLAMDGIAAKVITEQINAVDVADELFDKGQNTESASASPYIFRELRKQPDFEHNPKFALECIESGKTVLAISHGTDLEGVTRRLVDMGFPESVLQEKLLVVEYLLENSGKVVFGDNL